MKPLKILVLLFLFINCSGLNPLVVQANKGQREQTVFGDSLIVSTEELGLKSNFTIHESAIDSLGADNWLLTEITGDSHGVIDGVKFAIDGLKFHFVQDSSAIDYDLIFAYPRLIPPPDNTVLETFSPENKDDPITERFVYYIATKAVFEKELLE